MEISLRRNWWYAGLILTVLIGWAVFMLWAVTWPAVQETRHSEPLSGGWSWPKIAIADLLTVGACTWGCWSVFTQMLMRFSEDGISLLTWRGRVFVPWPSITTLGIDVFDSGLQADLSIIHLTTPLRKVTINRFLHMEKARLVETIRRHGPSGILDQIEDGEPILELPAERTRFGGFITRNAGSLLLAGISASCTVVIAAGLISHPLPSFGDLTKIEGSIGGVSAAGGSWIVRLDENGGTYEYSEGWPHAFEFRSALRRGLPVTLWVNGHSIWQAHSDERMLLAYGDVRDHLRTQRRWGIMGCVFSGLLTLFFGLFPFSFRRDSTNRVRWLVFARQVQRPPR